MKVILNNNNNALQFPWYASLVDKYLANGSTTFASANTAKPSHGTPIANSQQWRLYQVSVVPVKLLYIYHQPVTPHHATHNVTQRTTAPVSKDTTPQLCATKTSTADNKTALKPPLKPVIASTSPTDGYIDWNIKRQLKCRIPEQEQPKLLAILNAGEPAPENHLRFDLPPPDEGKKTDSTPIDPNSSCDNLQLLSEQCANQRPVPITTKASFPSVEPESKRRNKRPYQRRRFLKIDRNNMRCPVTGCNLIYNNIKDLQFHKQMLHGDSSAQCPHCLVVKAKVNTLGAHVKNCKGYPR